MSETTVTLKCKYNLYSSCIVYENTKHAFIPTREDCSLCIKVWRLKKGLRTVHEFRGSRYGVTL